MVSSSQVLSFVLILIFALSNCEYTLAGVQTKKPMEKSASETYTPLPNSPERKALLDAVRRKLNIQNQFSVDHLKVNQRWAYFSGNAVVFFDGERQEVNSVKALLERRSVRGKLSWVVVEIWTLEQMGTEQAFRRFVDRVMKRRKLENVPESIFPTEL